MNIYFAGATRVEEGYPRLQKEVTNRLVSYHYQTPSLDKFYYIDERDKYKNIILDSGAFSAWSQGVQIDVHKYAEYIMKWIDKVDYVVNLDVIPATPGQKNIPIEEIERSASKGYENYWILREAGVPIEKLIHVFHQNEDMKWLKKMVHEDKMPYIGLSPANDRTVKEKRIWLDDCMPYVTDDTGLPIVKFHGFAVTSFSIMQRYPWASIDSSTWAVAGGRGGVLIPIKNNGKWDFTSPPRKLLDSQIGGKKEHFSNMHKDSKNVAEIIEYAESVGLSRGSQTYIRKKFDYVPDKSKGERVCTNSFIINIGFEKHVDSIRQQQDHICSKREIPIKETKAEKDKRIKRWQRQTEITKLYRSSKKAKGLLSNDTLRIIDINQNNEVIYDYLDYDYIWVERIKERGICNYWKMRQLLNAIFMNTFVAKINEKQPLRFTEHVGGFFKSI